MYTTTTLIERLFFKERRGEGGDKESRIRESSKDVRWGVARVGTGGARWPLSSVNTV